MNTYALLKTAIADWEHRTFVSTQLDDFIDFTEEMFRAEPRAPDDPEPGGLRVEITRATGTLSGSTLAKPADFLAAISFDLTGTTGRFQNFVPTEMIDFLTREGTGRSKYWNISDVLQRDVATDAAYPYQLSYYSQPAALSGSVADNVILTTYPQCYLTGCLHHANLFIKNDEGASAWLARYKMAAWRANSDFQGGRFTQGALASQTDQATP